MGEPSDLDGRPGLEHDSREGRVQLGEQVAIPVERLVGMDSADDVQFGAAVFGRLSAPGENLLVGHQERLLVARLATIGAELAAIEADVRRVEVGVEVVVDDVAVLPAADLVGQFAQPVEVDIRAEQEDAFFGREAGRRRGSSCSIWSSIGFGGLRWSVLEQKVEGTDEQAARC